LELKFDSDKLFRVQNENIQNPDYIEPIQQKPEKKPDAALAPTPNNPPWNSGTAFLTWLLSVIFIIFIPSFFLIPYILQSGINLNDSAQLAEMAQNDPTAILFQMVGIIPAHILTFIAAWLVVTNFNKHSFFKTIGWEWGGFNVWYCIVITIAFFILGMVLTLIFGEQDHELQRILRSSRAVVYVVAFMATFTAPIVEELIYRGILFSAFQRTVGVVWAVVVVTFLFASVHFWQYQSSPVALLLILALSLVLTLIRAKTGNLLPSFALHTVFNGLQALFMILQPILPEIPAQTEEKTAFIFRLFN
jgi:Predicted metal-dependent membrane protease